MRSSIACARCRRSKVKCVNNGVGTVCRACESTGRECTYPTPGIGANSAASRREPIAGAASAGDGAGPGAIGETPKRRPPKKSIAPPQQQTSSKESLRALVDALDPNLLTPKVWTELFDIYLLHFSTDLPFLHPPNFLKPLRQSSLAVPQSTDFGSPANERTPTTAMPPLSPVLLLAFLALTSRFHPQLVAHHSPPSSNRPSKPLVAAEYYAIAARSRLAGEAGDGVGIPTLERTQALLMLALHEWGMCQGAKAWISLGVAVRSAQVLGLQYEQELDDEPLARSLALNSEAQHMGIQPKRRESRAGAVSRSDSFIEQEILRRTFWSCFVLDRYMSSGKYRPQMLHVKEIRIQLPSSERAFHFGEKVRTLLIGEEEHEAESRAEVQSKRHAVELLGSRMNGGSVTAASATNGMSSASSSAFGDYRQKDEEQGRWEIGPDEGVVSRFIKLTELYGRMVRWSCRGGRRTEEYPPWDQRSTFHSLRSALATFLDHLPRDLTLNTANIHAHITSRTSTPYILMHTVFALCQIILHREYIPFIPLRCSKPQGPLDPPLFPPDQYQVPEGFWEDSARDLFKSARELMNLLRMAEEWGVLVETPIVGFAIYTVAFTGVYASQFPWMDPDGYMCTKPAQPGAQPDHEGFEATRKAFQMIGSIKSRLKMAEGWVRTVRRSYNYFGRIKKDFRRNTQNLASSSGSETDSADVTRTLSLREGGTGGGLEEYKLLELTLKEFGSLEDEDLDMTDAGAGGTRRTSRDDGSENGSQAVKSEGMDLQEGTPDSNTIRHERWNAINSVAAAASHQRDVMMSGMGSTAETTAHAGYQQQHGVVTQQHPQQQMQQSPGYLPHLLNSVSNGTTPLVSPNTTASIAGSAAGTPYSAGLYPPPSKQQPHQQSLYPSDPIAHHHVSQQQPQQQQHQMPNPAGHHHPHQAWSPAMREEWLNNLDTRLGGDDVAAFVDGSSWEDWTGGAPAVGGWLGAVWGNVQQQQQQQQQHPQQHVGAGQVVHQGH